MDGVDLSEAKMRFGELVARAEAGETVNILRQGRLVAQIAPPLKPKVKVDVQALRQLVDRLPSGPAAADVTRTMREEDRY